MRSSTSLRPESAPEVLSYWFPTFAHPLDFVDASGVIHSQNLVLEQPDRRGRYIYVLGILLMESPCVTLPLKLGSDIGSEKGSS